MMHALYASSSPVHSYDLNIGRALSKTKIESPKLEACLLFRKRVIVTSAEKTFYVSSKHRSRSSESFRRKTEN